MDIGWRREILNWYHQPSNFTNHPGFTILLEKNKYQIISNMAKTEIEIPHNLANNKNGLDTMFNLNFSNLFLKGDPNLNNNLVKEINNFYVESYTFLQNTDFSNYKNFYFNN